MGVGVHALDGIGSQRTQRRQRGCNTQTDEAQVALGEDGSGDLQGGGNDQGTNAVGEQMLFDDTVTILFLWKSNTDSLTGFSHPLKQLMGRSSDRSVWLQINIC